MDVVMTDEAENKTEYEVIGIRFKDGGKIYYFDPCGITAKPGENLIVLNTEALPFRTRLFPKARSFFRSDP